MAKKCKKCGAHLDGFMYKTIGKLFGLKQSAKDPELCNKCEPKEEAPSQETPSEPPAAPPV